MSVSGACRFVALGLATISLLAAIGLTITAMVTPAWQTLESENGQYHEHGLWLDCLLDKNDVRSRCTFKIFEADQHEHNAVTKLKQHRLHGWLEATLYLLISAVTCGFLALLFSFCAPCVKGCSVVWNIFCLLSCCLASTALAIFFANSHKKEFLFVRSIRGELETEQLAGYSFYCAVAGAVAFLVTFMFSVIGTIVIFMHDRRDAYDHKTWPKHHTAV